MKKKINILCLALLALFLSHYAGATMFFHTHNLDGKQVTHSHPYTPTSHHTHSVAGFQLIASLSTLLFTTSVASLAWFAIGALCNITAPTESRIDTTNGKHRQLRAPPIY